MTLSGFFLVLLRPSYVIDIFSLNSDIQIPYTLVGYRAKPAEDWILDPGRFLDAQCQPKEFFTGKRTLFDPERNLKGIVFQKKVWTQLAKIPCPLLFSAVGLSVKMGA
jgi:O6-methylguanine-DNA--protein-cysteine methyltransferase